MFGVVFAFRHLNRLDVNAGVSYARVAKVFGPALGFFAGWSVIIASRLRGACRCWTEPRLNAIGVAGAQQALARLRCADDRCARPDLCRHRNLQILTGQAGKSSETMQPERAAGHEVHEF
jgi:hypothetical protein